MSLTPEQIERVREYHERAEIGAVCRCGEEPCLKAQLLETIATLTAERDQLAEQVETLTALREFDRGQIAAKDGQRDALRTALEEIATGVDHPLGNAKPAFYEAMEWAGNVAREALGGKS